MYHHQHGLSKSSFLNPLVHPVSSHRRSLFLPLNIATNRKPLIRVRPFARNHRIHRSPQILASHGNIVARIASSRPAIIQLPTVDQIALSIEHVELRRARGLVSPRHILAFVIAIRKGEPKLGRLRG